MQLAGEWGVTPGCCEALMFRRTRSALQNNSLPFSDGNLCHPYSEIICAQLSYIQISTTYCWCDYGLLATLCSGSVYQSVKGRGVKMTTLTLDHRCAIRTKCDTMKVFILVPCTCKKLMMQLSSYILAKRALEWTT